MGTEVILTVGIFCLVAAGVGIFYLLNKPSKEVAGTSAAAGESFSLRAAPPDDGNYKLWVTYHITWTGVDHAYGLEFDLDMEVDGASVFSGRLRMGAAAMTEEDRAKVVAQIRAGGKELPEGVISPVRIRSSRGRRNGIRFERATIALRDLGPRRAGSRIAVRGTITPAEGTMVNSLYVFLAT